MQKEEIELMNSCSEEEWGKRIFELIDFIDDTDQESLCALYGIDEQCCTCGDDEQGECSMTMLNRGCGFKPFLMAMHKFLLEKSGRLANESKPL